MTKSDAGSPVDVEVGDRIVRLTNPDRVYFPARGETKLDLARYYLAVADGIVGALRDRPCMLHRFPTGVTGEKVHQKRLPKGAPDWVQTVRVHFPRWNRTADELCVQHPADVIWAVQMSTVEFHPWNSRRFDVERPDEWRIDLDPMPEATYADVRRVADIAHEVLDELGATGWPKTSGGKGIHIYVRIPPVHGFADVRRAALAFAREVERRAGGLVDLTWWRKDRDPATVFVDYNQNARDHTIRCAYSVRGVPEAVVSTPIRWDEVDDAEPQDFTIATVPQRVAQLGDLHRRHRRGRVRHRRTAGVGRARCPSRSRQTSRSRTAPRRATTDAAVVSADGNDVDDLAVLALAELDRTVDQREQRVVATDADVAARVDPGAALADDDRAGGDLRAVEDLHAQALGVGVTTVAGGPATFRLGHLSYLLVTWTSGRSR